MSTATLTQPAQTSKVSKADRRLFGPTGQPIPATKVYRAPFSNFSDENVTAEKWMLVNENNKTVVFANSYDGKLGEKFNLDSNTRPLSSLNGKRQKRRLKADGEYKEVQVSSCPFAVEV